jgi:hypothetical protein
MPDSIFGPWGDQSGWRVATLVNERDFRAAEEVGNFFFGGETGL